MSVSNRRRNLTIWVRGVVVVVVVGVLGGGFWGEMAEAASRQATTITSGTMTAQGKSRTAVFEKDVVLTREDMVIRADRMTVHFKKDAHGETRKQAGDSFGQRVDVIEAQGNVIIEKSDGKATSGRAVYYKDEEKVVLTESPVAWQEGTRITGTRMTIYLKEERSIVEGGSHVVILEEPDDEE